MSYDVQLAHTCPHQTFEEPITLGSDRRSLKTSQPCVLRGAIRVWANDSVLIPSVGLHSFATVQGSGSGPFNITTSTNILTITTSSGATTVTLPTGARVTTARVVSAITSATIPTVLSAEATNGRLKLTDRAKVGTASKVVVSGTAATAVGFTGQQAGRGRQVYPGWTLHEETVQGFSVTVYPKFNDAIKTNPRFTVSYTVPRELCKRCQGSLIENDYRFGLNGDALTVSNENLLQQVCMKAILTGLGSNPYYSWYGSSIMQRIGSKALPHVQGMIREDVWNALQMVQRLQSAQARYQLVTPKERLHAIQQVGVFQHKEDPTCYLIEIDVQNASSERVNLSVVFTVPGVTASLRQVSRFLPSS